MNEWEELLDFERVFFEEVAIKLSEKWEAGKSLNTILRMDYDLENPDMTSIEIGHKHVIYFEVCGGEINIISSCADDGSTLCFALSDPETTPSKVADGIFDKMGTIMIEDGEKING